jgi:hypothetical protein
MIVVNDDTLLTFVDLCHQGMSHFTILLLSEQVIAKCHSFLVVPLCHDGQQTPSTKFLWVPLRTPLLISNRALTGALKRIAQTLTP